jgi:hypothetical protein
MRYFLRSLKYFVSLCVLCLALVALMSVTGNSALTFEQTLVLNSERYTILLIAIAVLSLFYPKFGFIVRRTEGDIVKYREQIIAAFDMTGFSLRNESEGIMIFCAYNFIAKVMMLGEDEIKVSQNGDQIELSGIRRGVAKVVYRLSSYIQRAKNE